MQINRLGHIVFPPATASSGAGSSATEQTEKPDASDQRGTESRGKASVGLGGAAAAAPRRPTPKEVPTLKVEQTVPASVQVSLDSSNKAAAPAIYSRESVAAKAASATAGPASETLAETPTPRAPLVIDQTPAEQFVASAVNILRDLDQGKVEVLGDKAAAFAQGHESKLAHAFGGLRHAVARLNVFA